MKKILLISTFLLLFSNTFALNIEEIKFNDISDNYLFSTKLYIPEGLDISLHQMSISKGQDLAISTIPSILSEFSSKIGENKVKKLLLNEIIYVVGGNSYENGYSPLNPYKESENNENRMIAGNETIHFLNHIVLKSIPEGDKILKWYPIDPTIAIWYADARWLKNYPKIFVFDDVLLPQNLKARYGRINFVELEIVKKYEIFKLYNSVKDAHSYAIIPYYEIKIPFDKSLNQNTIILSYDNYFFETTLKLTENGEYTPFVEYIKY